MTTYFYLAVIAAIFAIGVWFCARADKWAARAISEDRWES